MLGAADALTPPDDDARRPDAGDLGREAGGPAAAPDLDDVAGAVALAIGKALDERPVGEVLPHEPILAGAPRRERSGHAVGPARGTMISGVSVANGAEMTTVIDRPAVLGGTPIRARDYPAWPVWDEHERANLLAVLEAGGWWQGDGDAASTFAAELAHYQGAHHGLALTNGTHALEAALAACDIGEGDEVIVPGLTFVASATAVLAVNATPVLVDIDQDTLCLDPEVAAGRDPRRGRERSSSCTWPGRQPTWTPSSTCAAGAACASSKTTPTPTGRRGGAGAGALWGDVGCFSMQRSKLMTVGEGGAVGVQRRASAGPGMELRRCGREAGEWFYHHARYGSNLRMTEWQGAVLRAQLARYPAQLRRRDENAAVLDLAIAEVPGLRPQRLDPWMDVDGRYCYVVHYDAEEFAGLPLRSSGGRAGRGGHPDERLLPGRHPSRALPPPAVRSPTAGQRAGQSTTPASTSRGRSTRRHRRSGSSTACCWPTARTSWTWPAPRRGSKPTPRRSRTLPEERSSRPRSGLGERSAERAELVARGVGHDPPVDLVVLRPEEDRAPLLQELDVGVEHLHVPVHAVLGRLLGLRDLLEHPVRVREARRTLHPRRT